MWNPSPQQAAVVEWARSGSGSAFVEAVAGAGKTTTLIEMLKVTQGSLAFCAYNRKIAEEIQSRVTKLNLGNRVRVGTFHSFGLGAWRRAYPDVKSGPEAAQTKRDMTTAKLLETKVPEFMHPVIHKLVGLAKNSAIGLFGAVEDMSLWFAMIDHHDLSYDIEIPEDVDMDECLDDVVRWSIRALKYHRALGPKIIDFDDMIYLPVVSGVRMWENDWVLVDECQDTNAARRAMARKMLRRSGRACFVGDRRQAIYGFGGADSDAVDHIVRDFRCQTLPLTVTYRCPKAVVTEAQQIVSHIEAHETAPEGVVRGIVDKDLVAEGLTSDDAVLCRKTKPLVELAYRLIRAKIPCHVEGKEIGAGLMKLVNRFSKARTLEALRDRLEKYVDRECEKLIAKGKETKAESLRDRVETVLVLLEGCATVDELRGRISDMFQDGDREARPTLTLSTVHKAKGREWDRVYILGRREYMPSPAARQQWQQEQENNLIYVAVTRSQRELVYVGIGGAQQPAQ